MNAKQIEHYAQITISKRFRNYDYGIDGNQRLYNKEQPPEYPLEEIEVPFHVVYGTRDALFKLKVIIR